MKQKQISITARFFNDQTAHALRNGNYRVPSLEGRESVGPYLLIKLTIKIFLLIALLMLAGCEPCYPAETWTASAYCPCVKCCGKSDGVTASGKVAKEGRTIACNWLKFGTPAKINGKTYIVEDRGARSIFGTKSNHIKRVDIFFSSHSEALKFGMQKVEVIL